MGPIKNGTTRALLALFKINYMWKAINLSVADGIEQDHTAPHRLSIPGMQSLVQGIL